MSLHRFGFCVGQELKGAFSVCVKISNFNVLSICQCESPISKIIDTKIQKPKPTVYRQLLTYCTYALDDVVKSPSIFQGMSAILDECGLKNVENGSQFCQAT